MINFEELTQDGAFAKIMERVYNNEQTSSSREQEFIFGDTKGVIERNDEGLYSIYAFTEGQCEYAIMNVTRDRMINMLWNILSFEIADVIIERENMEKLQKELEEELQNIERLHAEEVNSQRKRVGKYIIPTPKANKRFCEHCGCNY